MNAKINNGIHSNDNNHPDELCWKQQSIARAIKNLQKEQARSFNAAVLKCLDGWVNAGKKG